MSPKLPPSKIARTALGALMALFAGVQYNDPDGAAWAALYAVPACCMAVAAFRPGWLASAAGRCALGVALVALAAVTVSVWPEESGFWRADVWWETESAREGLGAAIALAVTAVGVPVALRGLSPRGSRADAAPGPARR